MPSHPTHPGHLPSIAEARDETRTPSPNQGGWQTAVRGLLVRLGSGSAEERHGLLGVSTINDPEYSGSFARRVDWKTWVSGEYI